MMLYEGQAETQRQYIEVGFSRPRTPILTYHIDPPATLPKIGSRVMAPIGAKECMGVVMGFVDKPTFETKHIEGTVEGDAIVTQELIELAKGSAKKYAVHVGDVLGVMLLRGLTLALKRKIMPTLQVGKPLTPVEQEFFERLQKAGSWDERHFRKQRKDEIPFLRALQKKGWVQIVVEPKKATTKVLEETYYRRTDQVVKKKPGRVQLGILKELEATPSWVSKKKLLQKVSFGSTSIRALLTKNLIEEKKEMRNTNIRELYEPTKLFALSDKQQEAFDDIQDHMNAQNPTELLLHGVTGSGKTEVYLQAASDCLARGKNVLALVPEISLTPQFLDRFISRFGDRVALLHSQRTEAQRLTEWMRILQNEASVIIGTRSAVFAPIQNIGLIVLDECHDNSYKQHEGIKYHALEIARFRARYNKCPIVLGSATPNIDTFHTTPTKLSLPHRVTGHHLPDVEIVSLKEDKNFGKKYWIGTVLRDQLEQTLQNSKQALLFLNRRGYSHIVYCYRCGSEVHCPHCEVTMTYHKARQFAQCHYCFYEHAMDSPCPTCHDGTLVHFGIGTQKVEEELRFLFPDANIQRLDRDQTTKKHLFADTLKKIQKGEIDILIGTQMIAKGLDFPNIELVGMVLADQSLYFADYRAAETTFQLITQVVGRSGRGQNKGKAILQTLQPEHYAIVSGANQDYQAFYKQEIAHREALGFPPFAHLVLMEGVGSASKDIDEMMSWLSAQVPQDKNIDLMGPAPAPISKIRDDYRFQLLLRSSDAKHLQSVASWLYTSSKPLFEKRKMKLTMDINPYHFL